MSVERRASTEELRILFREIHRLSVSLKNLDFSFGDNLLLLPARGVLELLQEGGPQTVPALAKARNSSRQNVQIIVDRLERLTCVTITPNPRHKRSSLVELTAKGSAVLADVEAQEGRMLQVLAARFSADETSRALECVRRVSVAVGLTREARATISSGNQKPLKREDRRTNRRSRPRSHQRPDDDGAFDEGLPVSLL